MEDSEWLKDTLVVSAIDWKRSRRLVMVLRLRNLSVWEY